MKFKSIVAITASVLFTGANLFVISAKQGNVNCQELLVKAFSLNHIAYATDPGMPGAVRSRGSDYSNEIADCSAVQVEEIDVNVTIASTAGQELSKYLNGGLTGGFDRGPVRAELSANAGVNSGSSSNNQTGGTITGKIYIDVRQARPEYVYCDRSNNNECWKYEDPCSSYKAMYRENIRREFSL